MIFWILAAIFIVVGVLFVLVPLLRKPSTSQLDRRQMNIDIAREQLAELEREHVDGRVGQEAYITTRAELESGLHADIESLHPVKLVSRSGKPWIAIVLALLVVPGVSIPLYLDLGSPKLAISGVAPASELPPMSPSDVNDMVATLREKLEQQPENLTGWMMLGRSYTVMGRFTDAAYAYAKALDLEPENPDVLLMLADALAMVNEGRLAGRPEELVNKVLASDPDSVMGLWLAGMAANQQGIMDTAIMHWTRLEQLLPADSEDRAEVRRVLAELGVDSSSSNGTVAQEPAVAAAINASVTVSVMLADELSGQLKPDDVVFIYARALQGPPMPLAAVKKTVAELPLQIILDDSMAMTPQMKLSDFAELMVGARVSRSGAPAAQSGDLFGEVSPVVAGQAVTVRIDSVVP